MRKQPPLPAERISEIFRAHAQEIPLLLTVREAAAITNLSIQKLNNWRMTGRTGSPPYRRFSRQIRYPLADLMTWIESQPLSA